MIEPQSYELITLLRRLSGRLQQRIDAKLKPYDLARSQYVLLYYLVTQPGLSIGELAELMVVESATLSGIVDTLVTKGLVDRVEHQGDRRRRILRVTHAGKLLIETIPPPGPEIELRLLQGLSRDERKAFKNIGYAMLENLEGNDVTETKG